MNLLTDTIAAIATAPGRGSVGIIRLSGPQAKQIAEKMVKQPLVPRHAHYGEISHPQTQEILDQGLTLFFPKPHSFTGEDVVEFQGHGGPVVIDRLLQALLNSDNIRLAKPGEFSERAFINDKIDLTQAEAIADLINASTEQAARHALHSLQGSFSEKINTLVEQLTQLRVYVEAAIDFPEEEIDFLSDENISKGIQTLIQSIRDILIQTQQGVLLQEGMTLVIAGKPNAGKSSLLNALAGRDSAIVSNIPGTTRDLMREHIQLDGMPLHIIDTAGLRDSNDPVEKLGIQRAKEAINTADHILLLIDSQAFINTQQPLHVILTELKLEHINPQQITVVYNKIDLIQTTEELPKLHHNELYLSAVQNENIDHLSYHLKQLMGYQQANEGGFTARRRHLDAIRSAEYAIITAESQLLLGAGELVAEDLRQAQHFLGEITGHITSDDLLGRIFSSFCIGK